MNDGVPLNFDDYPNAYRNAALRAPIPANGKATETPTAPAVWAEPVIAATHTEIRADMSEEVLDGRLGEIFQRRMKGETPKQHSNAS